MRFDLESCNLRQLIEVRSWLNARCLHCICMFVYLFVYLCFCVLLYCVCIVIVLYLQEVHRFDTGSVMAGVWQASGQ